MDYCPECNGINIRTFSNWNERYSRWEWMKGCNQCNWEDRSTIEEAKHPECYTRTEMSPARI